MFRFRYLSTGLSFEALAGTFLMDSYTIGRIVKEVCENIYEIFWRKHMPIPTPETFERIAKEYETMWQFPLCVGKLLKNSVYLCCWRNTTKYFALYYRCHQRQAHSNQMSATQWNNVSQLQAFLLNCTAGCY